MPLGPKWTMGISGHYSEVWTIALRLGAEACGSQWKPVEAMEVVGKQWKTCGRQGRGWKGFGRCRRGAGGPEEVRKAVGKCRRGGKAWEVTVCYMFHDFKSQPAILSAIPQEISILCLVFRHLEGQHSPNSSGTNENEKTLSAVLNACMRTFQQIGSQICELQSRLCKGLLSKAYTFMLYPSRMKEISALRAWR